MIAAVRTFRAGVEQLVTEYTLEDVRRLVEAYSDEHIHDAVSASG